ncbi:MAG: dATP/dGTP diphosphohydrolase domain-containing protein [Nitrospiraceae bacterium]
MTLPTEAAERKAVPLCTGVLDYFPAALAEVARVSKAGNDQHNPGEPLHWARGKSMDQADCILRHLAERGTIDVDGVRHSAKLAWRALALLQLELEADGAPMSRGSQP